MSKMKCIQITSPCKFEGRQMVEASKVELVEQEIPKLTPGHAIIRTLYGGVCGSDIGTYLGAFLYAKYPQIPGHEYAGEIVDIDENNPYGLKKGMIVTVNPYFNCGECYTCKKGFVNCCPDNQTMGCSIREGAYKEYISMPLEKIYDGKGMDPRTLVLIEPFCISYHAVKLANVKPGDRVLVVGAGTIGYLAGAAAKMLGAEVYMADVAPDKLENAKKNLGLAGVILNDDNATFPEKVAAITDGAGFDVCFEAVGFPSTVQNCIDAATFHGRIVIIGVGKTSMDFFYPIIQKKELQIFGSRNALKEDFIELIDAVNAGKFDLSSVISKEYNYLDAPEAFPEIVANHGENLKVIFKF